MVAHCQAHDNYLPPFDEALLQATTPLPTFYSVFKKEKLIGFARIFFFYEYGIELLLLVHPTYRHQKVATTLIKAILPLLAHQQIQFINFYTGDSESTWLHQKGARQESCQLELQLKLEKIILPAATLSLVKATHLHAHAISELDKACFAEPHLPIERINALVQQPNYHVLLLPYEGQFIGKVHVKYHSSNAYAEIFDLCILPAYRKQRLGTQLLQETLIYIQRQQHYHLIKLTVEKENRAAVHLYLNQGFTVVKQDHYWRIKRHDLLRYCQG